MSVDTQSGNTELVIALVGPIGTNLVGVKHVLRKQVEKTGYRVKEIKVSQEIIPRLSKVLGTNESKYERYKALIKAGNECRANAKEVDGLFNGCAALASGVCAIIYRDRDDDDDSTQILIDNDNSRKKENLKAVTIIDSLKRPEEVDFLRSTYPHGFILLGVYETEADRLDNLCGRYEEHMTREEAVNLMNIDAEEEREPFGQRVRDTFQKSDFFVYTTKDHGRLECDLERMVRLWFGDPFVTPTFDELAMYMAFAYSLRSADLSRQVGAVVARDGQILALGANDVPKFGGGLYCATQVGDCVDDIPDGRDYIRGQDSNRVQQLAIMHGIAAALRKKYPELDEEGLMEALESSMIADITEYGRVVHAEMEALLSCGRAGISPLGATLFSSTFPCHNCAKHIVAAGINKVVYIEPYAKSKALEFHTDSIEAIEPGQFAYEKVCFEPYVGVGPRKFFDLFSMRHGSSFKLTRKDSKTGKKKDWRFERSQIRLQMLPVSYLDLELEAVDIFQEISEKKGTSYEQR